MKPTLSFFFTQCVFRGHVECLSCQNASGPDHTAVACTVLIHSGSDCIGWDWSSWYNMFVWCDTVTAVISANVFVCVRVCVCVRACVCVCEMLLCTKKLLHRFTRISCTNSAKCTDACQMLIGSCAEFLQQISHWTKLGLTTYAHVHFKTGLQSPVQSNSKKIGACLIMPKLKGTSEVAPFS